MVNKALEIRENPGLCYQCSKCSSGCPVAEDMELLPHQVMHYVALGMEDRVLRANTIWLCAGCFTCAVRCPNDIDITSVMDDLRGRAVERVSPGQCPGITTDKSIRQGRVILQCSKERLPSV